MFFGTPPSLEYPIFATSMCQSLVLAYFITESSLICGTAVVSMTRSVLTYGTAVVSMTTLSLISGTAEFFMTQSSLLPGTAPFLYD